MDVGIQLTFAKHGWPDVPDGQVVDEELRLARLAEDLGFDVIWSVEHHFFDYSFCPDNTELLAYLAGVTTTIDLGTAAVILPWNEPLRVAEKIALLDHLADGRLRFGIGRGLSRREFAAFRGIEMSESRERFDEAADHDPGGARDRRDRRAGAVLSAAAHRRSARARRAPSAVASMPSPAATTRWSRRRGWARAW